MPRKPFLNIYKEGRTYTKIEWLLVTSEVKALRVEGKLPSFAAGYEDEDIQVTTVTRLDHYKDELERTGGVLKPEFIRSNLTIFADETFTEVKVVYKQNVFKPAEARDLGERSDHLYENAPFVARSKGKQVGL